MGLIDTIKNLLGTASTTTIYGSSAQVGSGYERYENTIGSFDDYREMRKSPTLAMARAIANSAIRSAEWIVEADDDAVAGAKEAVDSFTNNLRPHLIDLYQYALDYGFQAARTPWTMDENGQMVVERVKSIKPEDVKQIEIFENSGKIASVKLDKNEKIEAENVLVLTYDGEGGDPFGRSRFENIRTYAFIPWRDWIKKMGQYANKAAGVIPIITFPPGTSIDENGQVINNSVVARKLLDNLPLGKGVAIPIELVPFAQEMMKMGMKYEDLMAWKITILDAKSGFGGEALSTVQHFEALQMRGFLLPERTALEGTTGTKAEAGEHADIMIATAEENSEDFVRQISDQLVQRFVVYNFGESQRTKIRLKAAPINDEARAIIKEILVPYLAANSDVLETAADVNDMMDRLGIPKKVEVVDVSQGAPTEPTAPIEPTPTTKLSRVGRGIVDFLKRTEATV